MVRHRSAAEYLRILRNWLSTDDSVWSAAETATLKQIARRSWGYEWTAQSQQFSAAHPSVRVRGRGRSALSLLRRFQRNLNVAHTRSEWTRRDDEALIAASKRFGESDFVSHSASMDRRLAFQCAQRLSLATGNATPKWTQRHELRLLLFGTALNAKFVDAAKFVDDFEAEGHCDADIQSEHVYAVRRVSAGNGVVGRVDGVCVANDYFVGFYDSVYLFQ